MSVQGAVDGALEFTVVPSFTRFGPAIRSRVGHWAPLSSIDLRGRQVVLTGATSGIGRAAAEQFAELGAAVAIVGRDRGRLDETCSEVSAATGNAAMTSVVADLSDLDAVRSAALELSDRHRRIDVLIHNAGALSTERSTNRVGVEMTVASQVLGPFLLTSMLLEPLTRAAPGRVLTMSSGGMYTADLTVDELEMSAAHYRGSEQYARAKRAQVALNELWANAVHPADVVFHALHPGWVDSPGLAASLPRFSTVLGPVLRTPDQGADTLVWLAGSDEGASSTGGFWLDRERRDPHRLERTRRSDTARRRAALWQWCQERVVGFGRAGT